MKKSVGIVLGILIALCVGVIVLFFLFKANPIENNDSKTITVEITAHKETETLTHQTEAATLREALDELELVQGIEAEYGLYVKTVNGITADEAAEEWWSFSVNGEMLQTGIETAVLADGDTVGIELKQGYDTF